VTGSLRRDRHQRKLRFSRVLYSFEYSRHPALLNDGKALNFRQCDEQPLWHTCTLHNDVLCHRKFDKRPPYVGGRDDKRHCNVSLNGLQPSNNRDKQPRERQNTTQTNASSLILLSKMYTKIVPNYNIHFMYRQLTSSRYRLDWKQKHGIWIFGMEIDMETSLYNILSNFIGNYMYNLITANQ